MNTTLPPERDLPPYRHAEIRAELQRAVAGGGRRIRYAPLLTAGVAAAAVIALAVAFPPWRQGGTEVAASTTPAPTTTTAPVSTTTEPPAPTIGNLPPERVAEIEQGCVDSSLRPGRAVLHQYVPGLPGGDLAVLYSDIGVLTCTVNGPTTPYNPSFHLVRDRAWLPGHLAADSVGVASGGDFGKAAHAGTPGVALAVGRVSPEVARVVYTRLGDSVEATIANGTYVARIEYPSDYVAPSDGQLGELIAYDAAGAELGRITSDDITNPARCWVRPDGLVVHGRSDSDPKTCEPASPWH